MMLREANDFFAVALFDFFELWTNLEKVVIWIMTAIEPSRDQSARALKEWERQRGGRRTWKLVLS
jgi:hypothetical protein